MSELKNEKKKRKGGQAKINFASENAGSTGKKLKTKASGKANQASSESVHANQMDDMMEKFDDLFLNEDKITAKMVKEFSKVAFSIRSLDQSNLATESVKLNYNNLIVFLLKFSGLQIEKSQNAENKNNMRLLSSINEDNCADFEILDQIIANSKVKHDKFKTAKVYIIFESIVAEIYNNYEITNNSDFEILKKFILNCLKLTQNKYRKIRYYSSLILINIFKLTLEEQISTQKLLFQRSKTKRKSITGNLESYVKTKNSKTLEESANDLLSNKIKILAELVEILKEKFLFKRISDVSKNIRTVVCDYIIKISKNHFNELFYDKELIKFYPFFLVDSTTTIKYKYLQLIYEKLDLVDIEGEEKMDVDTENEEEDKDSDKCTIKTVISILSVARDAILNICVKEEKIIAKQAIRIIELLSQHNILEPKTVQSLLPHLFNPEVQIRNLISKVVINYILNFEKPIGEEAENEDEDPEETTSKSKSKLIIKTKVSITTVEHLIQTLEFFYKLAENDEKLVKVLVENFYKGLSIFNNYHLFFELIDILLNSNSDNEEINQNNQNILQTLFLVLIFSVEALQTEIESSMELSEEAIKLLIPKNEEFINLFVNHISGFIKKIRINLTNSTQCENFNYLLHLFERFKIYAQNLIKFTADELIIITVELKNSFFINMSGVTFDDEDHDFYEKLVESILKGIHKVVQVANKGEFSNLKRTQLNSVIYSENSSSLARDYCDILYKEILSSSFYRTLSNIKSDEFHLDSSMNGMITQNDLFKTLYIILTQFNYLLTYFRDIFLSNEDNDEDNLLDLVTFSNFLENLIRFIHKFSNRQDEASVNLQFKVQSTSISVIETIHLINLNQMLMNTKLEHNNSQLLSQTQSQMQVKLQAKRERYISHRNNIIITLSTVINNINYIHDVKGENIYIYNNCILKLKTQAVNKLLEMLIYISSEKIENPQLKFTIEDNLVEMVEEFLKNNFVKFYYEYNKLMNDKEKNTGNNVYNITQETQNVPAGNNSIFKEELSTKTFCFKSICEKFSRLLLLNLGIFKYTSFCCLYFEAFYLLKLPAVIDNLDTYVYESLHEKEILHFTKIQNMNNFSLSSLNVMIFYLTKITMRVFTNKSRMFEFGIDNENENVKESSIPRDERIEMISRYVNLYMKGMKKMKVKFNKEGLDVLNKDKSFFENFIVNSINFALESRREIITNGPEEEVKESVIIHIENVKFFEVVKFFMKTNMFLNEVDHKNILMIFLRLSKPVELMENVHRGHIRIIEKFKSFLLSKAKVFISSNNYEEPEDEVKDKDVTFGNITGKEISFDQYEEKNKDKNALKIKRKDDQNNFENKSEDEEEQNYPEEDERHHQESKKKKIEKVKNVKEKKEKKGENIKNTQKKRTFAEAQKEKENEVNDSPKIVKSTGTTGNKKKKNK